MISQAAAVASAVHVFTMLNCVMAATSSRVDAYRHSVSGRAAISRRNLDVAEN